MKNLHSITFISVFFTVLTALQAQDIHFSQHFNVSNYINPSFNGLAPGMSRFSLNAKNQWLAAQSPFQTYVTSFDNSWKINRASPSFFSTSGLLYYDVAGDADFSTLQFNPSLAYTFVLNSSYSLLLSIGIQPGFAQRSLDMSKLRFDSQFNGYQFDPSLSTNEIIDHQSFYFADFGAGIHFINYFDRNTYASAGFSMGHINRPVVSVKNMNEIRLDMKYIFHSEVRFYYKNNVVLPTVYYALQGTQNEILIGGRVILNRVRSSIMENNLIFRKNFLLGLYYRSKDALIAYAGMEFQNYNIGLSYDINLSRFTPASQGRGGFEISAAYIWQKTKRQRNKDIPCPIF